jgi:DNA repair protein RadC
MPNDTPQAKPKRRESERERYMRLGKLAGLRLVREGGYATRPPEERVSVRSPRDVVEIVRPFADRETAEAIWLVLLDAQHRIIEVPAWNSEKKLIEPTIGPIVVTRGILNSSLCHPREVFKPAILHGAAAVILVHNHPSGDPTPSADDRVVTEQMMAAGRTLDIPVHDHVIIGQGRYTSFAEAGLL